MLKIEKRFTLYCFFENKVHFYLIILINTKSPQDRCVGASRFGIYPLNSLPLWGIVVKYNIYMHF